MLISSDELQSVFIGVVKKAVCFLWHKVYFCINWIFLEEMMDHFVQKNIACNVTCPENFSDISPTKNVTSDLLSLPTPSPRGEMPMVP